MKIDVAHMLVALTVDSDMTVDYGFVVAVDVSVSVTGVIVLATDVEAVFYAVVMLANAGNFVDQFAEIDSVVALDFVVVSVLMSVAAVDYYDFDSIHMSFDVFVASAVPSVAVVNAFDEMRR